MSIGARLQPLTTLVAASLHVRNAGDVPHADLRLQVVRCELRLDFSLGVVQHQVVTTTTIVLAAANAGESELVRQLPWRHVEAVRHRPHHNGLVRIAAVQEHHQNFAADTRDADLAVL
ncbi:hypothetical protein D3C72_1926290 [compost metagenome]